MYIQKMAYFLCLILYACLYVCMSVSNSEPALRISLNSCILLAHIRIRRKNVRPICGKKSVSRMVCLCNLI